MRRSTIGIVVVFAGLALAVPAARAGGYSRVGIHLGYHHGHHHRYHARHYYPISFHYHRGPYYAGWRAPYYYYEAVPVRAARVPRAAAVETDIKPKKAQVFVDGRAMGQARDFNGPWDLLFLRPGDRTVEFVAPGYQTLRLDLEVLRGGYYHVKESLTKGEGLDPRSGALPDRPAAPRQPPPATGAGSPPEQEGLRAGRLHVSVEPRDAAVYLDGKFLARGDELSRLHGAIPVAAGEHTLEVLRPGYRSATRVVLVEAGEPAHAHIRLDRD